MDDFSFTVFPDENFLDLRLYQYGWEQCAPLHSCGPSARDHYLFHYVIAGQGQLCAADQEGNRIRYDLHEDQGFLICPGQRNAYCADKANPWKYAWLEFDGLRAKDCLDAAGLNPSRPIYRPQDAAQGRAVRDAMLCIAGHPNATALHRIGHLYLFLDSLIASSAARQELRGGQLKDHYIQEAVVYMEHNYQREVTIEELAAVCKLNRSYFSKLFKENMGCPPQEFLIRLRLTKAAEMLRGTNDSIGGVAAMCGYPNQLHFSRAFHKRYGLSPREWRIQNQVKKKR